MSRVQRTLEKVQALHGGFLRYRELLQAGQYERADQVRSSLAVAYGEIRSDLLRLNVPLYWGDTYRTFPTFESALTSFDPLYASCFSDSIKHAVASLEMAQGVLQAMLDSERAQDSMGQERVSSNEVFIVHGHDAALTQGVARFIERIGLKALVLSEQPRPARTIVEQIDKRSDVGCAVVLMTPDDMGYPKESPDQVRPRARQNVVLELGYFLARLGRDRVCVLHKGGLEMPSDIGGVLFIPAEDEGWKLELGKMLKESGLDVDLDAVFE